MIVYGDAGEFEAGEAVKCSALAMLAQAQGLSGIARHSRLVDAFIRTGELAQGMADAQFEDRGSEVPSPLNRQMALVLLDLARAIDLSWSSGFRQAPEACRLGQVLSRVDCPNLIRTRTCEGYAHYALYPESYLEAARRSGLGPQTCVIGIRSIGVGLAALVAAALGSGPAISLRPVGHPFERNIRADPELIPNAVREGSGDFAIVDEGPGLSGSSFAAVIRWLRDQGVTSERICLFPSHGGTPGPQASANTRTLWAGMRRHDARSDDVILHGNGLAAWFQDRLGLPLLALEEISAVQWPRNAGPTPPGDARFERRKFLARTECGSWLVKFAGLGRTGARKYADARHLAEAGFTPEIAGFIHGFLVQRWLQFTPCGIMANRRELVQRLGSYLAFRAAALPPATHGASLGILREMAVYNTQEACGSAAAMAMERKLADLGRLQLNLRPVRTDNRLHQWEWIEGGGTLLKTDAVDHCEGHDLIGCQDIAWDVAGAICEFELSDSERKELLRHMRKNGAAPSDPELIDGLIPCYLAFQLGIWSTAAARSDLENSMHIKRVKTCLRQLKRALNHATAAISAGQGTCRGAPHQG